MQEIKGHACSLSILVICDELHRLLLEDIRHALFMCYINSLPDENTTCYAHEEDIGRTPSCLGEDTAIAFLPPSWVITGALHRS